MARLRLGAWWRAPLPLRAKLAFTGHLALSLSLPSLLVLLVLHPVVAALGGPGAASVLGLLGPVALTGVVGAHVVALRALHPASWRRRLSRIPAALAAPVVLVGPAARAVAQAAFGRRTPFARTPKGPVSAGEGGAGEIALALYSAAGLAVLVALGAQGVPFQLVLTLASWAAAWAVRRTSVPAEPVQAATMARAAA